MRKIIRLEVEVPDQAKDNIQGNKVLEQRYKLYDPMVTLEGYWYRLHDKFIDIEIKQEDMEENNLKHSNSCKIGKNLKPFNLEEAKAGKPVCTRDGRKARIICFDKKAGRPIVVLVEGGDGNGEYVIFCDDGGYYNCKEMPDGSDLMMAPERHEGWINVYKGGKLDADYIYPTKETAITNIFQPMKDKYIDTVKVEWEE